MIAPKTSTVAPLVTPRELTSFGDPISVGDWVKVRDIRPWGNKLSFFRVDYIRYSVKDPLIMLSNHLVTVFGWYHQPGRPHVGWLTFEKLKPAWVPPYLRGDLVLDPVLMLHSRQLSKREILDTFYESRKVDLSVVISRPDAPWLHYELIPVSLSWRRTGNRSRQTLVRMAPAYSLPGDLAWSANEQKLSPNGCVFLRNQQVAFFAPEGQGQPLKEVLMKGKM